jgi:hypothetical protein
MTSKRVPTAKEYERFWFWHKLSFPLGVYCDEYERDYCYKKNVYKDCGTCQFLRLGQCARGHVPNIKGEKG